VKEKGCGGLSGKILCFDMSLASFLLAGGKKGLFGD